MTDVEYAKQYIEEQKLTFDYIKHITTLDTGSIVLLATFLEKFFKKPEWRVLIIPTFLGFVVSAIALGLASIGILRSIRTPTDISTGLRTFTAVAFLIGVFGFLLGMTSLALLAVKNWL
jgi:hypothetical protein